MRPASTASAAPARAASPAAVSRPCAVEQLQRRPAARAGDRLGVEPPVGRIVVFGPARGAHRERGHRGPRPVVGQLLDDRPARAAVRAIGERIVVASLGRIADFGQALARTWPDRRESSAAAAMRPCSCESESCRAARLRRSGGFSWISMASMRACGGWSRRSASTKRVQGGPVALAPRSAPCRPR